MIPAMAAVMAAMVAQVGADSLVKAHEEGLGRIKTLRCTIDERMSVDGGTTWTTTTSRDVRRSGDRERVHMRTFFRWMDGDRFEKMTPVWHLDALFAPDGVRSMDGYDPEHPPREPITVANEKDSGRRLGGMIRPPLPYGPWGYKGLTSSVFGGEYLLFFLPEARYSARDLCEATKDVIPSERRDGAGKPLWELPLKTPDGKSLITLTFDPGRGYAIAENKGTNIASGSVATRRVVDWHEPAPGIFVPKTIRIERPQLARLRHEFLVRDVAVNAPIPEAELAFRFPRGLGVGDEAKDVFYLWGDGEPERTFTAQEYNAWRREQMELLRFQ